MSNRKGENQKITCACGCGETFAEKDKWYQKRQYVLNHHCRRPVMDRFFGKVRKTKTCWFWTGAKRGGGYGIIIQDGKRRCATHVSLELHGRKVPEGMYVLHACDIPACVNPDHLWLGTLSDNTRDCEAKGRANHPVGEKNGRARLNASQVEVIKQMYKEGRPMNNLWKLYRVTRQAIRNVVHGKSWKHLQ